MTTDVERLAELALAVGIGSRTSLPVVTKPFFGGAALYVGGTIIASLSRVGLAFKIGEPAATALISDGKARPLRYFPGGHIKKGYALFEDADLSTTSGWESLFELALVNGIAADRA